MSLFNDIYEPIDAFGRFRTSEPYTLFNSSELTSSNIFAWSTHTSNNTEITFDKPQHYLTLKSGAVNGNYVVRQTHAYNVYQPGKSMLCLITGSLINDTSVPDIVSRIGYYDDIDDKKPTYENDPTGDGVFFQLRTKTNNKYDVSIVFRTSINVIGGIREQNDYEILQKDWNGDPCDGSFGTCTNPLKGIDYDFTKRTIFWFSIEWLGVGNIKAGIIYNNQFILCHTFKFNNALYDPNNNPLKAYMTRGSLPVRYSILYDGSTQLNKNVSLIQVCSTVISEGGFNPAGFSYSFGSRSARTVSYSSETPVLAFRHNLNANYKKNPRVIIRIQSMSLVSTTTGNIEYKMYLIKNPYKINATYINTGTWYNAINDPSLGDSSIEYNDTFTDGLTFTNMQYRIVYSGVISKELSNMNNMEFGKSIVVASSLEGYTDVILITAKSISTGQNEDVYCKLTVDEFE